MAGRPYAGANRGAGPMADERLSRIGDGQEEKSDETERSFHRWRLPPSTLVHKMREASASVHFEQEAFEVLPFRTEQRDRMVGGGREPADERNAPPCVLRRGEDDLLEEVERHVAAAGEGHHPRAGIEELHSEEVDVFVAAGGAVHVAARFGKGGRVANEEN